MSGNGYGLGDLGRMLYDDGIEPVPDYPLKRAFDVAGSLALIGLSAPVMVLAAGAIMLEGALDPKADGPVLYVQKRYGKGGEPFDMLKFRTMYDGADRRLHEVIGGQAVDSSGPAGPDPRVTRVGRFLRKHHLDELPQTWDVLRGRMSIVGPRPHDDYRTRIILDKGSRTRYRCRPGLTGPFQTRKTDRCDVSHVGELEDAYVKSLDKGYSLWGDVRYVFKSLPVVLFGRKHNYRSRVF
jgi:lipopolysaccharide/colanic/teichoic acid biosynthesis glycosyltransferase